MQNNRKVLPELTDKELVSRKGETIFCDVEIYQNYFLIMFYFSDGSLCYFEGLDFNKKKLLWVLENFEIVTFNGMNFDIVILLYFLYCNPTIEQIQRVADMIINQNTRSYEVYKKYNIPQNAVKINHIDIKEVCIGQLSLKAYAGRIHAPYMQDLPYDPYKVLEEHEKDNVLKYCVNDCINTMLLFQNREKEMNLRRELTIQYSSDCRSKSDAQIAEVVISRELEWKHGVRVSKTTRGAGHTFKYNVPDNISFQTPVLQKMLENIKNTTFTLLDNGKIGYSGGLENYDKPKKGKVLTINNLSYTMGIGGLHSNEKKVTYISGNEYELIDSDVTSYYPFIILNQQLYPKHLGKAFLQVYKSIVDRRIEAKVKGDKSVADTLKIVINGSFGKFGSQYSFLFSPELLIQTTLSGQLYLIMAIEALELNGFEVASANTDGIVTKVTIGEKERYEEVIAEWEKKTGFNMEFTKYLRLCGRDVNNYIAIKEDGKVKFKGGYADDGIGNNPSGQIIYEAVSKYLLDGTSIEETINNCKDIKKFVFIRTVKGGCVDSEGNDVGKVVRYYYQKGQFFPLRYKTNGNKVPKSDGASPLMDLSVGFPNDIDNGRYIHEAYKVLSGDFDRPENKQPDLFSELLAIA